MLIIYDPEDADIFKPIPVYDASKRMKKRLTFVGAKTESNSFSYKG